MEKKFSQKYLSLVQNIIEDSGLIDEDKISSLKVRENPFSDQIDIMIEFHPSSEIGRSYVDELVDELWDFVYSTLNVAVAIHTNWNELTRLRKQNLVSENFDLWVRRRINLIEGLIQEVLKDLSSKRNLEEYFSRITFAEFVDIVFNEVVDEIHFRASSTSERETLPVRELFDYLHSNYKNLLKKVWLQNRKS